MRRIRTTRHMRQSKQRSPGHSPACEHANGAHRELQHLTLLALNETMSLPLRYKTNALDLVHVKAAHIEPNLVIHAAMQLAAPYLQVSQTRQVLHGLGKHCRPMLHGPNSPSYHGLQGAAS